MNDSEDEMLSEYVRLALAHGRALDLGDIAQSDLLNAKLIDLFKNFVALGIRDRLLTLHCHADASVRCWAALEDMESRPDQGLLGRACEAAESRAALATLCCKVRLA